MYCNQTFSFRQQPAVIVIRSFIRGYINNQLTGKRPLPDIRHNEKPTQQETASLIDFPSILANVLAKKLGSKRVRGIN